LQMRMMRSQSGLLVACVIAAVLTVSVEGTLKGRFIHLTDTHLLRAYGKGTDPAKDCIAGKSTGNAGEFGDYNCDSVWIVQNFTEKTLMKRQKPDFILYGGDHTALKDPNQGMSDTEWYIKDIARLLREVRAAYGSDVRVFPMLGNHDSYPFYQFPEKGPFFAYETAAEAWKDFLSPESIETVRKGAYYTELIEPGLRIVVVNTAMYFDGNWAFPQWTVDPGGMLAWLRSVLQKAKDNGEYVFLAGHVPPGSTLTFDFDMWIQFNDQYVEALNGFNGFPIAASFYGHHHWTTYRIISNENVTAATSANSHVGFVSSSLTPRPNANPCFTEYTYMTTAPYTVIDRSYEYIDLDEANRKGTLEWKKAKSYGEIFSAKKLDVETLNEVVARMHKDPNLFRAYYEDLYTHSPAGAGCRTGDCRALTLCGMNYTISTDVYACMKKTIH